MRLFLVVFACLCVGAVAQLTHPDEVAALKAIKGDLVDPLKKLSNWKHGDPCTSNWTGIVCYNRSLGDGYLHVQELELLNLNLSGTLSPELGRLSHLKILDFMWNKITGNIPKEVGNITALELFLLDNNNLTGHLPPEFSKLPNLLIVQLDNNDFEGTTIPASYGNMSKLLKLSLRNCRLQGPIPDLSRIPHLGYLDLSSNQLNGSLPTNKLSPDITTIILSNNSLTGNVSANFAGLPRLQKLDFENNKLTSVSGSLNLPPNVTLLLKGNPLCSGAKSANILQFCNAKLNKTNLPFQNKVTFSCPSQACPESYEYPPTYPVPCVCAAPLIVVFRLKSPGFKDFRPYKSGFETYLSTGLTINLYQLYLDSFMWQDGLRLQINLKLFPPYKVLNNSHVFNDSEVRRLYTMFTGWNVPNNDTFGPYELLDFIFLGPYDKDVKVSFPLSVVFPVLMFGLCRPKERSPQKSRRSSRTPVKVEGVKIFGYKEMAQATRNFSDSVRIGQGGYGKVYKGVLDDGTEVAIKRAQEGSLQGEREFCNEIKLLSRIHHRNLVALVGYCDEEDEQMLVYQFMPNLTIRDHLSGKGKEPLSLESRLEIALGSAEGICYLHNKADPPIFHRDVKASNILLDSKFKAKVADFGLSRLAPVPDMEGVTPSHVTTGVKGTLGYLDPEYLATFKLTDKSDVYSLGVVFMELITGMLPISGGKNIVREVSAAHQSGNIISLVDPRMGRYPPDSITNITRFITLALRCCHDDPNARPSMTEVVRELENILDSVTSTPEISGGVLSVEPTRHLTRCGQINFRLTPESVEERGEEGSTSQISEVVSVEPTRLLTRCRQINFRLTPESVEERGEEGSAPEISGVVSVEPTRHLTRCRQINFKVTPKSVEERGEEGSTSQISGVASVEPTRRLTRCNQFKIDT